MFDRSQRVLFDGAAEAYDEARPGYPVELINALVERAQLPTNARILEIGCGTGQLTRSLAQRGYEIIAVELGERLADLAAENLKRFRNVCIEQGAFEVWPAPVEPFDLVVCAQAFHWIDPEVGYAKIHRLLKPTGHLAVIYNLFPGGSEPVDRELEMIYAKWFPKADANDASQSLQDTVTRTLACLREIGGFNEPVIWSHPWIEVYTTARHLRLLDTFSDHLALPDETRASLYSEVKRTIDAHGGIIERPLQATLFLVERTP